MRRFFIWLPQGRLGNLIFQYQAIAALSGRDYVLALDSEFFDLFETPRRFIAIPCFKRIRWRLQVAWVRFFESLAKRELIGTIKPGSEFVIEKFAWESADIRWKKGWCSNVFLIKGFFQTERYIDPLPKIKRGLLRDVELRFAGVPRPARVAIHMRIGDYANWPVFGVPGSACLPESYYVKAISIIRKNVPGAHFFLLSDEPERARFALESAGVAEQMRVVVGGTALSDFALITSCSHAIVSASSFGLWAALLIENPSRLLIAPEFWLGFARKTWLPPRIRSAYFIYIDPLSGGVQQ